MLQLWSADGCPYVQRSRALLALRGVPYELKTIDLRNKPPEFLALSPTGRVPLLVDGPHKLYESAVINEYLRELTGWEEGLSVSAYQRARERLAMLQFDNVISPIFWASLKAHGALDETQRRVLDRELDELERTVTDADARVNLLGLHVVPHVLRWYWLGEATPIPAMIEARPVLKGWVDELAAQPCVQSTLPERAETVAVMRRMAGI